jgi:hypothetical protein
MKKAFSVFLAGAVLTAGVVFSTMKVREAQAELTTVHVLDSPSAAADFLSLLRKALPESSGLASLVAELLERAELRTVPGTPSVMVVFYRVQNGEPKDVVVQLLREQDLEASGILNPEGLVRGRVGGEVYESADNLLALMYHHASYAGDARLVAASKRAVEAGWSGDLTFLREMTVEPLYVVVIVPQAGKFLPGSLRSRVKSVVAKAELTFSEWRNELSLFTEDNQSAEQVGLVVASWRDMAKSMADTFASHTSGAPLREALETSSVRVEDNQVISAATVPAATAVRAAKEIVGHGAPKKVVLCHKGRTIEVAESAVPAHLAHGDTLGPCPVTICHKGRTIQVPESALAAHLAHGDTIGPCPGHPPPSQPGGNNGVGNGEDPQPPGNPPINDGPGTGPGNPGNRR